MAVMLIDCAGVEEADTELRYLKGTLTEDEAEAFEAHFTGCERCWMALHRAIELGAALPAVAAESGARALRPRWQWAAGAAAALLIIVGTTWSVRIARRHPAPASVAAGGSEAAPAFEQARDSAREPDHAVSASSSPSSSPAPSPSPSRSGAGALTVPAARIPAAQPDARRPPPPIPTPTPPAPAVASGRGQPFDVSGDARIAGRRPDLAIAVLDSARRVADAEGLSRERVKLRIELARADGLRGESATAVRWAGGAVRIADSLGDPDAEIEARKAYGAALAATGDVRADDQYRRAITLLRQAGRVAEARDVAQRAGLSPRRDP